MIKKIQSLMIAHLQLTLYVILTDFFIFWIQYMHLKSNNPNVHLLFNLEKAIKQVLLRSSIFSSHKVNVLAFEAGTQNSIFSLTLKKIIHC